MPNCYNYWVYNSMNILGQVITRILSLGGLESPTPICRSAYRPYLQDYPPPPPPGLDRSRSVTPFFTQACILKSLWHPG